MKIGALIPIRLASERLPGKALKDLAGRPVVHHLLDRVAACRHIAGPKDVVVCTTTEPADDALGPVVEAHGCSVFRGSVDDIVRRFGDAMAAHGFDAVVQADGDDPLSATEYMDLTMDRLRADPALDIVTVTGVPLGTATKSFTRRAMDKVLAAYRTERNDTGFIYFFTRSGLCRHVEIDALGPQHVHPTARLTLDYEADLALFRRIFEALYRPGRVFGLAEVVAFLDAHPDLVELNRHVEQEYWRRTAEKAKLEYVASDGSQRAIRV
jgi:spore coat polysaccharide biosynthesis protein SpsF (cytidylyltransferase family)